MKMSYWVTFWNMQNHKHVRVSWHKKLIIIKKLFKWLYLNMDTNIMNGYKYKLMKHK